MVSTLDNFEETEDALDKSFLCLEDRERCRYDILVMRVQANELRSRTVYKLYCRVSHVGERGE